MTLPDEAVKEFQGIYKEKIGKELSFEQAKIEWDSEVPSLREIMDMGNSPIRLKAAVNAIVKSIQGYQSHASLKGEVAV